MAQKFTLVLPGVVAFHGGKHNLGTPKMRTGIPTLTVWHLVMLSLVCQMSLGQEAILPEKLSQVRSLVVRTSEPIFLESILPDPVERAAWLRQQQQKDEARIKTIKTMPGLTLYLFALLKENYEIHPNEGMVSVLEALALRDDLKAAEIESIATEAQKILSRPYVRMDQGSEYLKRAVSVFGKYPSAEHEKILIGALERGEEEYPLYVRAALSLEKMGGRDSLAALDRAILKTAHFKNTEVESFHSILVNSRKVIQDKLKSTGGL